MPIFDESAAGRHSSGLYRFLERRERDNFERWEQGQRRRVHNGCSPEDYPRERRMAAFEAGVAVNVSAGDVWGWSAVQDGAPTVPRPVRSGDRVIVQPDDTIAWSDDDWASLFLEENGL
jgi:hypothetical protein